MTRPKSEHSYDHVVIESTTDKSRPGRELVQHLLDVATAQHPDADFAVEHHTPTTRDEFFALLERLAAETQARDGRPVLHLEIHGNEQGTALVLENGEQVPWRDLTDRLVAINIAARGISLWCSPSASARASARCSRTAAGLPRSDSLARTPRSPSATSRWRSARSTESC